MLKRLHFSHSSKHLRPNKTVLWLCRSVYPICECFQTISPKYQNISLACIHTTAFAVVGVIVVVVIFELNSRWDFMNLNGFVCVDCSSDFISFQLGIIWVFVVGGRVKGLTRSFISVKQIFIRFCVTFILLMEPLIMMNYKYDGMALQLSKHQIFFTFQIIVYDIWLLKRAQHFGFLRIPWRSTINSSILALGSTNERENVCVAEGFLAKWINTEPKHSEIEMNKYFH